MKKYFLILSVCCSPFTSVQARNKTVVDHEIELERLLLEYRAAVQESREESQKNRKLLRKCLKKLEEQEKRLWGGKADFKMALLFKLATLLCLYQDYQEPALGYKIAALLCLWLI